MRTNLAFVGAAILALLPGPTQAQEAAAPAAGAPAQTNVRATALAVAATIPQTNVVAVELPGPVADIVKLASSGVGEDVVLAFVRNTQGLFNLSAENVLYLKDIGISSVVIAAMLTHDSDLRSQTTTPAPAPTPATPPAETPAPTQPNVESTVETAPVYVSNPPTDVVYFYSYLQPYGTWISLSDLGWCWQPQAVVFNRNWRPYCDNGQWVYTDAGWYWNSGYSWGWAPFHYGRWYLHPRCGWVWQPDRVWGPAWVTWRNTDDYCGWAPLPPRSAFDVRFGWRFNGLTVGFDFDFGLQPEHFTFVALRDLPARDLAHCRLPPPDVRAFYRHTRVVNHRIEHDRAIINRGVPVDRVAAVTRTPIRPAQIRELPRGSRDLPGDPGGRSRPVIYRPRLEPPPPTARPPTIVAQQVDEQHPTVRHPSFASRPPANRPPGGRGPTAATTTEPGGNMPIGPGERPRSYNPAPPTQVAPGTFAPSTPRPPRPPSAWSQPTVPGSGTGPAGRPPQTGKATPSGKGAPFFPGKFEPMPGPTRSSGSPPNPGMSAPTGPRLQSPASTPQPGSRPPSTGASSAPKSGPPPPPPKKS